MTSSDSHFEKIFHCSRGTYRLWVKRANYTSYTEFHSSWLRLQLDFHLKATWLPESCTFHFSNGCLPLCHHPFLPESHYGNTGLKIKEPGHQRLLHMDLRIQGGVPGIPGEKNRIKVEFVPPFQPVHPQSCIK